MAKDSSQKFIARNRAPRVQIEYEVELYGSEKKIQLPFVMGVLADLSGTPATEPPPVEDRKFHDIDVDNFDKNMKAIKPRVAFRVPNVLTGKDQLNVELTFEKMDDFSPAAVASKVEGLSQMLQTRKNLSNLLTWMDGKRGAEILIAKVLKDPALLASLAAAPKPKEPPEPPEAATPDDQPPEGTPS
jgi:type VI secretion system protein ImpB